MQRRATCAPVAALPRWRRAGSRCLLAAGLWLLGATPAGAAETARTWLGVALHAADTWADDAQLVWVENDASMDANGRADAWGFLFYAPSLHAMRSYSVRDGILVQAQDQPLSVVAPPIEAWIDSDVATRQAWRRAIDTWGEDVRLENLLLVRGVFAPHDAWVAVFARGEGPRLFVVCDAKSGDVLRAWRG